MAGHTPHIRVSRRSLQAERASLAGPRRVLSRHYLKRTRSLPARPEIDIAPALITFRARGCRRHYHAATPNDIFHREEMPAAPRSALYTR